jgi:hypothetical protein
MALSWYFPCPSGRSPVLADQAVDELVPFEKYDPKVTCTSFRVSGGIRVFVDKSAQDGFSADLSCVDVGHGGAGALDSRRDAVLAEILSMRVGKSALLTIAGSLEEPASGQ